MRVMTTVVLLNISVVDPLTVDAHCWLGLLTCNNRLPYNLYCVGGDVKHCSLTRSFDAHCCRMGIQSVPSFVIFDIRAL